MSAPPYLTGPDVDRISELQTAWANYLLQGSAMPDTLRDVVPELLDTVMKAADVGGLSGDPAVRASRLGAAFTFAVLRDSQHLSAGHRHCIVRGVNTRTRHLGLLAGSSLSAGTGGVS